jgi:hypothetical protein
MLPISTKETVRYVPSEYDSLAAEAAVKAADKVAKITPENATAEERAAATRALDAATAARAAVEQRLAESGGIPTYFLAVPSLRDRLAYRRALAATGARYATDAELLATMREGVNAVVAEDQRAILIDILDRFEGAPEAERAGEIADQVEEIGRVLRPAFAGYAELLADRQYWLEMAPLLAAQHFLRGWENAGATFKRTGNLAAEDCLRGIPERHLAEVGWKALALMGPPSKAAEKN